MYKIPCVWYLLEDDSDDVQLLQEAIEASALPITLVHFYEVKAMYQQLQSEELPNVIILDINLPMTNGIDILQSLKQMEHIKDLPVVMFTSADTGKYQQQTLTNGAEHYISKPYQFSKYNDVVHEIYSYCMKVRV